MSGIHFGILVGGTMSAYDKVNVGQILQGEGDWFGAQLLRLIAKADVDNRLKLSLVYPDYVRAYEAFLEGST